MPPSYDLAASTGARSGRATPWRERRWVLIGTAVFIWCCAVAFGVWLMWQTSSGSLQNFDQTLAYAAVLCVAALAPVITVVLLYRLSVPVGDFAGSHPSRWLSPVTVCMSLAIGVTITALVVYRLGSDIVTRSVERRLQAVATLKAALVKTWLEDTSDDIRLSAESPELIHALQDWRNAGAREGEAQQRLIDHLWRLSKISHYVEFGLRDASTGGLLLTTSGDADSPEDRRLAVTAAAASAPLLEDFHLDVERDQGRAIYMGYLAAATLPGTGARVVVHVGIDPRHELFPLIEQWPDSSETAEVLLLRRKDDAMQVLNNVRGQDVGPLARRIPVGPARYIAAAMARGSVGALRGDDDHDRPVLAYAVPVPSTSWLLVATQTQSEAFAELNRIALLAASIVGALSLLGAWWWVEHRRHVDVEREHQQERSVNTQRMAELSRRIVLAQEEERRRWSSELHDRTGANLAAINLNLKAIGRAIPQRSDEDDELLNETSELLSDTVASIRDFCSTLRPAILDYSGLVPALQTSIDQFRRRTGVEATLEHADFSGRCGPELESALFRIVQEALMNIAKHARATRVKVTLSGDAQRLRLCVEDNGTGFSSTGLGQGSIGIGHGLLNMQERAAFIGAAFRIDSTPGQGTRVHLELG
jgi:signal transduction histidine kinase